MSFVYGVKCPALNAIKIGFSNNPETRFSQIKVDCPLPVELAWLIPGGRQLERQLHEELWKYRMRGEWFFCNHEVEGILNRCEGSRDMAGEAIDKRIKERARI